MVALAVVQVIFLSLLQSSYARLTSSPRTEISLILNKTSNEYTVLNKIDENLADAYGYYYQNYEGNYWNYLEVFMQKKVESTADHVNYSRAMGYLEGYATCSEIRTFWPNFYSDEFGTESVGTQTIAFLKGNYLWMKSMAQMYAETDDYWYTVKATLAQLDGLLEGFKAGCTSTSNRGKDPYSTLDNPTIEHFLLINAWGDLYQITTKYREPGFAARLRGNRLAKYKDDVSLKTSVERCSAIIKLLADKSDVVYGHGTWDGYESLGPRILKHYSFQLMSSGSAVQPYDVYFSSSPALLSSIDDFFTVSGYAHLGVMETTNNMYNLKLLDLVVPETVLSWQRAVASNQLAKSGTQWGDLFSRYHSGTYTNQWMVLDLNLFTPGNVPSTGFLTVFEEVPGLVHVEDQTAALVSEGYWGSYNVPVYEDIAVASGYTALCKSDVTRCHDTCPRANIFREKHTDIADVEGGKFILFYNDFQNDTNSLGDSCNMIACRGDLEPSVAKRAGFGALDAKVTTATRSNRNPGVSPELFARIGPSSDQQKVFCWTDLIDEPEYSHLGQPNCFDFTWVSFPPSD